jgi:predicted RNA-binding Zn-ribbon protein involved in translation (DUF1610 family)
MKAFLCPQCSSRTRVTRTVANSRSLATRYRICKGCGFRITTEERIRGKRQPIKPK